MKMSLLATAAAVVALTASAAQAQVVGHVGANYARQVVDVDGPNPDLDTFQLEGAAGFAAGSLNALIDGAVTGIGGDVNDQVDFALTGHLNGKLGNALVGGWAGVNATEDLNVWALGAEGQMAVTDAVTLYGQAGVGYSDDLNDAMLYGVRGEARYFVNENLKLQAQAGWSKVDTDDLGSSDTWTVGVEGEYQFAGTPWSVLASYDYADSNDLRVSSRNIVAPAFETDFKTHTFRVGGRYTFGGATLKARDAAGADLGSIRKLFPNVNERNAF